MRKLTLFAAFALGLALLSSPLRASTIVFDGFGGGDVAFSPTSANAFGAVAPVQHVTIDGVSYDVVGGLMGLFTAEATSVAGTDPVFALFAGGGYLEVVGAIPALGISMGQLFLGGFLPDAGAMLSRHDFGFFFGAIDADTSYLNPGFGDGTVGASATVQLLVCPQDGISPEGCPARGGIFWVVEQSEVDITPVPEPGNAGLFASGLLGLFLLGYRKHLLIAFRG